MNNFWFDNYKNVSYPQKTAEKKKEEIYIPGKPITFFRIQIKNEEPENNISVSEEEKNYTVSNRETAMDRYSDYIIRKILYLNCDCKINFRDMCILVKTSTEGSYIERKLNKYNIPYSYYKKKGLMKSVEANEIYFLLRALSQPFNRTYVKEMLLTRFFHDYSIDFEFDEKKFSDADNAISRWNEYFAENGFYYMMKKIISETCIYTRIMKFQKEDFSESAYIPCSGERTLANYKQIIKKLNSNCAKFVSLRDFSDYFRELRENEKDEAEESYQEKETDKDLVQIMTMHASKGLEFPVVFIFGGWTNIYYNKGGIYSIIEGNKRKYSFNKNIDVFYDGQNRKFADIQNKETLDEYKRLIYVAYTRAKTALFIPYVMGNVSFGIGKLMPGLSKTVNDVLKYRCNYCIYNPFYVEENTAVVSHPQKYVPEFSATDTVSLNKPDDIISRANDVRYDSSFSGLKGGEGYKRKILKDMGIEFNEDINDSFLYSEENLRETSVYDIAENSFRDDDSDNTERETEKPKHLPAGTYYGTMYHEIFEKLDFASVMDKTKYSSFDLWKKNQMSLSNERNAIRNVCSKYGVTDEEIFIKILKMVWNTLHLTLPGIGLIGEMNPEKCVKEINFTTSYSKNGKDNFVSGIIDMLFEDKNGDMYILDWKSNLDENDDYSPENLEKIMKSHDYNLQWFLYKDAVNNWLKSNGYSKRVRGVFYVFVRQAELDDPYIYSEKKTKGVFYKKI